MKRLIQRVILLFFVSSISINAQDAFVAEDPVLITSAGQSADILMVKILAKKAQLNYTMDKSATVDQLADKKSILVVAGGSTKGLGAAKIDKADEYARVESLINQAKDDNIQVIAIHVGGKSRRGALSDYFNKLVAENADHIIVVSGGNEDLFFTNIANEKGIQLDTPEKIILTTNVLKIIYNKE